MERLTVFTVTIEDINQLDTLCATVHWAKEKIKEVLPVLYNGDCCKQELSVVALRLEQALSKVNKVIN